MRLDSKLSSLPTIKSKPELLDTLFGNRDVHPMWVADMDFEVAPPIQEALINRVSGSGFAYEYTPESFYVAREKWYQKMYGIKLLREHVLQSPSILTSISIIIENHTEQGDGVIIQPPVFMEFKSTILKSNRKVVKNPLKFTEGRYEMDFDNLEKLAQKEENKVLILCNPHNPVGKVWTQKELKRIIEIAKTHNLILISDEIHKDIVLFDNKFHSILNYQDEYDKLFVLTSEAKTFNLCSLVDTIAVIPNDNLREKMKHTLSVFHLEKTNALGRVALQAAYEKGEIWLKDMKALIEQNVNSIEKELENCKVNLIKPEGTYQVWLDFRERFKDSKDLFRKITKVANVGVNAGHWFGKEGALFIRMNIATSNEQVVYALRKLISILR
ncbi:hypothetical protein DF185_07695 [Marinifilum breve]|uniref:cysteine-S-conjugate beta-lyase n=1 Tax=Marinifilum breve TaxID=2184082 RepID=A0A2V4A207_9BACT|nr:PatB family C-S lyase [Marinifilum breve]PXY01360.1 hypothetical protein DF185_07695 [Marinifilum breve]